VAHRLGRYQEHVDQEFLPGPTIESDQEWLAHIASTAGTSYHPTSTCMVGSHERTVVDSALRVYGIVGLSVIDASIMPAVVCGNANAATTMIAEKSADMVLAAARTASTAKAA
jgi:choline dehydrogenase-like flavoprotein